jgi:CMP-N,N'-diacetyllegionaminic acid synthase
MKILGIIPARGGSKGVPGKNSKLLAGRPLLTYTADRALEAEGLNKVVLTTDCETLAAIGRACGLEVPFLRPPHLATDTAASIDVVQHVLDFYQMQGETFDAICLLQPTSPCRAVGMIDEALLQFEKEQFDALVSVLPVPHEYNPHWVFEPTAQGELRLATGETEIIKRRQDLPPAYFRDGALYLTRTEVIRQGSFLGKYLGYIISNPDFFVNIDTMNDWEKAERLFQNKK